MKYFFEEYGLAIFSAICIFILIMMVNPLSESTKTVLNNQVVPVAANGFEYTTSYVMADKITEVNTLMVSSRNAKDTPRTYSEVADEFKEQIIALEQSSSFIAPISGAGISAGVWKYPESFGGGVHLGIDYAVSEGTNIVAPANGIVVVSSDGCSTGFLGDTCSGRDENAVSYGGNQIYFITSVNNKVYAITFSHMQKNSVVSKGVYNQGDVIGKVGASGNATGAHSHIEMFYLGEGDFGDIEETYLRTMYSSSFGCGWGDNALTFIEGGDTKSSSGTYRVDPTKYLGGTSPKTEDE